MKFSILILVLILPNFLFSQFAIVNDRDGFVNVRISSKSNSKIIDKLPNGFPVYCLNIDDSINKWTDVDYAKNNKDFNGSIFTKRLKYISSFESIPLKKITKNFMHFEKDKIQVTIEGEKFKKDVNKLEFNKKIVFLQKINGKKIYGTDGEIPKIQYKLIKLSINGKYILLPKSSIENLFEPTLLEGYTNVNYDSERDILYITASNSDGAGGYEVIWIIEKGKFRERKIAYGF